MDEVIILVLWVVLQCFTPCCYGIKNTPNLESKVEDLDKDMKSLNDLRSQVELRMERSSEEQPQDAAKAVEWLEKVEKLEKSAISIRERVAAGDKGRARTAYSEWKWKRALSREVVGLLDKVKGLKKDGNCF